MLMCEEFCTSYVGRKIYVINGEHKYTPTKQIKWVKVQQVGDHSGSNLNILHVNFGTQLCVHLHLACVLYYLSKFAFVFLCLFLREWGAQLV